jgi:hypothetical protein
LLSENAGYFGIGQNQAKEISRMILDTVGSNWRKDAEQNSISPSAIDSMDEAFSECRRHIV